MILWYDLTNWIKINKTFCFCMKICSHLLLVSLVSSREHTLRSWNHSYSLERIGPSSRTVFLRCLEERVKLRAVRRVKIRYFPNMSVSWNIFPVLSKLGRHIHECELIHTHAHLYIIQMYQQKHQRSMCLSSAMCKILLSKICLFTKINITVATKTFLRIYLKPIKI